MKRLGIAILLILMTTPSASAIECKTSPGRDGHYSWRSIDGKRCWYRGHVRLPKERLHWPRPRLDYAPRTQAPPPRADSPVPSTTSEPQTATGNIWDCCGLPPTPSQPLPSEHFADRWNETQFRLLLWNGVNRVESER